MPQRTNTLFRMLEEIIAETLNLDTALDTTAQATTRATSDFIDALVDVARYGEQAHDWGRTRAEIASADFGSDNTLLMEWYQEYLRSEELEAIEDSEDWNTSEELDNFLKEFALKEVC